MLVLAAGRADRAVARAVALAAAEVNVLSLGAGVARVFGGGRAQLPARFGFPFQVQVPHAGGHSRGGCNQGCLRIDFVD